MKTAGKKNGAPAEVRTMLKRLSRTASFVFIGALLVSCCAMTGCIEASFELASESRLPKWIILAPGLTRADVSVTMNYHTLPIADFILKDKNGKILTKVRGKVRNLEPLHLKALPPGSWEPGRPAFEIITVNGTTEIIEHKKREPIFYVSDDPAFRKELLGREGLK